MALHASLDEHLAAPEASFDEANSELVLQLNEQISDKDELIAALTSQLEEAVERLDRLHRQGADRGLRASGATSSPVGSDFIDEQRYTNDRLNDWLDAWEQACPIDVWARLEAKIEELAGRVSPPVAQTGWASEPAASFETPESEPAISGLSSWEAAKMRLLGEMPAEPAPAKTPTPIAAMPADVAYPAAIDLATAERDALCEAIDIRDRYISYLTHRLRSAEIRDPVDWQALNQAPADLRQQLQDLEVRYREHLRREECDLALERARLAREQARLEQDRHRLEQQLRRSGLAGDAQSHEPEDEDRSWRKMFGRKK